ncbi:MAG: hypothetical protein U0704_12050 [Candidatus Eisenbacteria bacterium]
MIVGSGLLSPSPKSQPCVSSTQPLWSSSTWLFAISAVFDQILKNRSECWRSTPVSMMPIFTLADPVLRSQACRARTPAVLVDRCHWYAR